MRGVQMVIIAVGGILLFWFFAPLLCKGIFNIGTATGILISLFLLCYGIFFGLYEQENALIIVEWQENTLDMCFPACPCTYNDNDSVGRDISDDPLSITHSAAKYDSCCFRMQCKRYKTKQNIRGTY